MWLLDYQDIWGIGPWDLVTDGGLRVRSSTKLLKASTGSALASRNKDTGSPQPMGRSRHRSPNHMTQLLNVRKSLDGTLTLIWLLLEYGLLFGQNSPQGHKAINWKRLYSHKLKMIYLCCQGNKKVHRPRLPPYKSYSILRTLIMKGFKKINGIKWAGSFSKKHLGKLFTQCRDKKTKNRNCVITVE